MANSDHLVLVSIEEHFEPLIDVGFMQSIAERVLQAEGQPATEIGVLVTDDDALRDLNREYAGEDKATDVLAFSLREGEEFATPDEVQRLGEVIISYPTAQRQAQDAGWPVKEEVTHLLVHGILHLLGYDHAEPEEERVMRERTEELLASFR